MSAINDNPATGCDRDPRCRRYDCQRTREFAAALLDRHLGGPDPVGGVKSAGEDFAAGEWEMAAICVVEMGPSVTAAEIDELERLADECMEGIDVEIAHRVVAKRRAALP